jgi:hypothetical protein
MDGWISTEYLMNGIDRVNKKYMEENVSQCYFALLLLLLLLL